MKATGIGITELKLRMMAWLCTVSNGDHLWMQTDSQVCIVTGPNIEMATELIRRLKNIFERKLVLIFQNKVTVYVFS
jgi:late competence protein required for DNA uptake (superfamily II DNA/RNA helicase)